MHLQRLRRDLLAVAVLVRAKQVGHGGSHAAHVVAKVAAPCNIYTTYTSILTYKFYIETSHIDYTEEVRAKPLVDGQAQRLRHVGDGQARVRVALAAHRVQRERETDTERQRERERERERDTWPRIVFTESQQSDCTMASDFHASRSIDVSSSWVQQHGTSFICKMTVRMLPYVWANVPCCRRTGRRRLRPR